jgi:hypothetical protein
MSKPTRSARVSPPRRGSTEGLHTLHKSQKETAFGGHISAGSETLAEHR